VPWEIFEDSPWQMSRGERAAIEGVLAAFRPALALEIGSAEGACLQRIASYAGEVHAFDLQAPRLEQGANVTLHTGDSHELLPAFLSQLAERGRNVDLVILDGDHSPEGVRQDLEDLLNSPALARSVILIHDTANERVRSGVDAVRFAAWPKVAHVQLDFIPGHLFAEPQLRNQLWYGIGLVLVDSARLAYENAAIYEQRYHPAAPLLAEIRDLVVAREQVPSPSRDSGPEVGQLHRRVAKLGVELRAAKVREDQLEAELTGLRERVQRADAVLEDITASASWKLTEPLRVVKRRVLSADKG
jgi:hypothetical protein